MLRILETPEALPVTLAEAREHCRAPEDGTDDTLVERALRAAVSFFQDRTSLFLVPTEAQYRLDDWPCQEDLLIPYAPVREVRSIKYLDENNVEQTLAEANWTWERRDDGALISWSQLGEIPALSNTRRGAIRVDFQVGHDDPEDSGSGIDPAYTLPADAKICILMLTSHWYESRGLAVSEQINQVPMAVETLMNRFRVF